MNRKRLFHVLSQSKSSISVLAVFGLFLLLWQCVVSFWNLPPILLPSPWRVANVFWQESSALAKGFLLTGAESLVALSISAMLGFLIAVLFSQFRFLRRAFYPYVVFLQTVPIVAIAPLLITWRGYTLETVVLVSVIISLFPIISNCTAGLLSVDGSLGEVFRLYGASRWQTLWKLRIPNSLSHLVLGLRVSAGLAVVGAIIGEFFVGSRFSNLAGLGTIMTGWQTLNKTDGLIAVVFTSTMLGLTILGVVNWGTYLLFSRWTFSRDFERDL